MYGFNVSECAVRDGWEDDVLVQHGALSKYLCSECGANLGPERPDGTAICLNACHLGVGGMRRFQQFMRERMPQKEQ